MHEKAQVSINACRGCDYGGFLTVCHFSNKFPLPLTDPLKAVRRAHCLVHICRRSVW